MSQGFLLDRSQSYLECSSLAIICSVDKKTSLLYHFCINSRFRRFTRGDDRSFEKMSVSLMDFTLGTLTASR